MIEVGSVFQDACTGDIDIRVSKAMGNQGYNKVRISVISNRTIDSGHFNYKSQFKYRWTNKYLSTGLVTVVPGEKTHFSFGGKNVDILLPKENEGTRGVIIADPCFQSQWIVCVYAKKFQMYNHTLELLNAINGHDDISYWQILGDNFYDQEGDQTSSFFAGLSDNSKSKMFATVPGNHDFWVNSAPKLYVPNDQLGNGFIQFYGQDTAAATATAPYDLSVNPDVNKNAENLPPASNFFFYNKPTLRIQTHFENACAWASEANPDVLLLLGHWNSDGDGCESEATVPLIYQEISNLPACAAVKSKIRYFMGHKHCNIVTEKDVGFMVGAVGMSDATGCGGAFGIPVVDTTGGTFKVYYFPIAQANEFDNYEATLACIKTNGVSGCYHLATLWAETPLV
eukprot:gene34548-42612_t